MKALDPLDPTPNGFKHRKWGRQPVALYEDADHEDQRFIRSLLPADPIPHRPLLPGEGAIYASVFMDLIGEDYFAYLGQTMNLTPFYRGSGGLFGFARACRDVPPGRTIRALIGIYPEPELEAREIGWQIAVGIRERMNHPPHLVWFNGRAYGGSLRELHADPVFKAQNAERARQRIRQLNADPVFKAQHAERARQRIRQLNASPESAARSAERIRQLNAEKSEAYHRVQIRELHRAIADPKDADVGKLRQVLRYVYSSRWADPGNLALADRVSEALFTPPSVEWIDDGGSHLMAPRRPALRRSTD